MKVFLAAAASLLLEPINAQQLASNQRRLRNRNLSDSTAALSKAGKSKASKSMEAHSLTGVYSGIDFEDATNQKLFIVCDDNEDKDEGGICNITLQDPRFSTCAQIVDGTNGGVGIANGVPLDSIDDFTFDLYCLQPDETVIDYTNSPTTTLLGNIEILQDGSLRRTGPGFFYSKVSLPEIKDVSSDEVANIDDETFNPNGRYRGVDLADGSVQVMEILCTLSNCDITLTDPSFTICKALVGQSFEQGVGIAKGVPRGSLSDFDIKLYCLEKDERVIDYDREPDATLPGNLKLARDGIIQRTGPGYTYTYIKNGPNEVEEPFSVYEDFALSLNGKDTEDGSRQFLEILCEGGLCDVELADTSFSTCIENIPGDSYLGGLAKATDVPQDSLYDFGLPLYCASNPAEGIDYSAPVAILKGNLVFPQPGIVKRIGLGFTYYNLFKGAGDDSALTATGGGSLYQGFRNDNGGSKFLSTLCENKNCGVIIYSLIEPACFGPSGGRLFFNGVAVNSNVPEDSLDNFEIELYCVPPGAGAEIDYENQDPIDTINVSITPGDQRGIIRLGENDNEEIILFKLSAGE